MTSFVINYLQSTESSPESSPSRKFSSKSVDTSNLKTYSLRNDKNKPSVSLKPTKLESKKNPESNLL